MLISKEFGSYNHRRYGAPWGARITFTAGEVKPSYSFDGYYDGSRTGSGGVVVIDADPGEIVAFGQRDHRGGKTSNQFYKVEPDGELTEVSVSEARKHLREQKAQD